MSTYATDTFAGDGATVEFTPTFKYISRDHVQVSRIVDADGSETMLTVISTGVPTGDEYIWESDTKIKVGTAPTSLETLKIHRDTPEDLQIVQWADGSYIIAEDLNDSDQQWLYNIQELEDKFSSLVTTAIKYRGGVDLTADTAPANPEGGDFYINTGTGNVISGWTGIVGDTVVGSEQVIYNGIAQQWQIFETPSSQQGVISITGTAPISVDLTDPQRPAIGSSALVSVTGTAPISIDNTDPQRPAISSSALTDVTVTAPLAVDKTNPAEPALDISNATGSADGAMSAADKAKLDALPTNSTLDSTYLKKAGDTYSGYLDSSATGAFRFPQGTTAQRPGAPKSGDVRFNTDADEYEGYDGTVWGPFGGGSELHVGSTPPSNPEDGSQWWDTVSGRTFTYYDDADSSQWVESNPLWASNTVPDSGITTAKIADGAVTPVKLDRAYVEPGDAITTSSINGGPFAKNQLINGDFRIWQRDTSGSVNEYGADRWYTASNDVQMNNDNARPYGLSKSIRLRNINSSTNPLNLRQAIELPFAGGAGPFIPGSVWTASIYLTSSAITPQFSLSFTQGVDGTTSGGVNPIAAGDMTLVETVSGQLGGGAAQTWYRYARTFTVDASAAPDAADLCALAAFSITDTSIKDYRIAGAQLELGPVATPFEHRLYAAELALCQRYFQDTGAISNFSLSRYLNSAGQPYKWWPFAQTMRAVPTAASNSGTWQTSNGFGGAPTFSSSSEFGIRLGSATSISANAVLYLNGPGFNMDAEL